MKWLIERLQAEAAAIPAMSALAFGWATGFASCWSYFHKQKLIRTPKEGRDAKRNTQVMESIKENRS